MGLVLRSTRMPSPTPHQPRSIVEPIEVLEGSFDPRVMARGQPGVPRRFRWRDRTFEIGRLMDESREVGPMAGGGGEMYVRRHVTRAQTTCGAIVELSASRSRGATRWILRSILDSEDSAS